MPNLHPPLSAFPVALLSVVFVLEIIWIFTRSTTLRHAITVNLTLACIAVIAAFYSGYQASELADGTFMVPDGEISKHHSYGRLLLFLVIPCLAVYLLALIALHGRRYFFAAYYILLILCEGLVLLTGNLGGKLVFEHGAGVTARITSNSSQAPTDIQHDPSNEPRGESSQITDR